MAKSVTNETKAKFESLLKVALNKKVSQSNQNLIESDRKTDHGGISGVTNEIVDTQNDVVNKNYILDKFLNDEEVKENESVSFIKPPVPKPRKKVTQQSPSDSNETYSVKSAKILNVINKNTSSDTNETYELPRRISRDDSDSSASSTRTYNINKESVGDILYHDKVCKTSIVEINKESQHLDKSRLSGNEIEMANYNVKAEKVQTIEDILNETDNKSVDSAGSTKITFENEVKGKKKRKKKEEKEKHIIETVEDPIYKYEKILNIIVHNTDRLELNLFVIHPVVKVYVVDFENGEFIKKSDKSRAAVFYMESKNLTYLMPVMTQNFNLQEKRQFTPEWEESIIINEDFSYITNPNTKVILFFEILDFVGFAEATSQSSDSSRGWHKIAWAFLKIVAADGTTNTGKKLRLQLYKPGRSSKHACPVFEWWRGKRNKYPATLYVTVKGITSPDVVVETFRSKTPLERERSMSILNDDGEICEDNNEMVRRDKAKIETVLSVLESKQFMLPNSFLTDVESGDEGCFVVKFSNTGLFLACAILTNSDYSLVLYTVPDFKTYYKLPSHQELIYNISFAKDDSLMASSSSDGTVCIWNLEKLSFLQILPHPSFVYWCEISTDYTIATGCYDKIVRIWTMDTDKSEREYALVEELEGHIGYVTSLCFNSNGGILYSSDSKGEIFVWKKVHERWNHLKTIKLPELKNTIINQILLHKKERKLIVHARDSIIRIVDVINECSIHWLEGALNNRVRTLCCTTSCGSYVISGSDNGIIHVWNASTGKSIIVYQPYGNISMKYIPIHAVDISPKGNLMAFSHFGHPVPINIYNYDAKKCSDNFTVINEETRLKSRIHGAKVKKDKRNSEEKDENEKDIDLKNILEKIDRIIS